MAFYLTECNGFREHRDDMFCAVESILSSLFAQIQMRLRFKIL